MTKKSKIGFSLIELIVVITIITITMASGTFYFYGFLNSKEMDDKIYVINRDFEEIEKDLKSYKISDYEIHLKSGLGYYYYTNYSDNDKKQTINMDFSSGTGIISTNDTISTFRNIKIYSNGKLTDEKTINSLDSYTGSFSDYKSFKIIGISSGSLLNNVFINYFGEENIEKDLNKKNSGMIKLDYINTKEDKTGTNIGELVIKNTGNGKEIYGDLVKINEAYLFFSKQGEEKSLKIYKK